MYVNREDVTRGADIAISRFDTDVPEYRTLQIAEPILAHNIDLIESTLEEIDDQWHPRAVVLFSELITIGMLARFTFNEPQISDVLVKRYAEQSSFLWNSFTHK